MVGAASEMPSAARELPSDGHGAVAGARDVGATDGSVQVFRGSPGDPLAVRASASSSRIIGELQSGDLVRGRVVGSSFKLVTGGSVKLKYLARPS